MTLPLSPVAEILEIFKPNSRANLRTPGEAKTLSLECDSGWVGGFIKVIFDKKYGEWLGCHMIGEGVTDMIAEAVLGRKLETTGYEILKTG